MRGLATDSVAWGVGTVLVLPSGTGGGYALNLPAVPLTRFLMVELGKRRGAAGRVAATQRQIPGIHSSLSLHLLPVTMLGFTQRAPVSYHIPKTCAFVG